MHIVGVRWRSASLEASLERGITEVTRDDFFESGNLRISISWYVAARAQESVSQNSNLRKIPVWADRKHEKKSLNPVIQSTIATLSPQPLTNRTQKQNKT